MKNKRNTQLLGRRPVGLSALAGVLACLLLVPSLANAQSSSAISGTVSDSTGGVLPGVTVEARSPTMIEQVRTAITDGSGQYTVIALEPGTYSITYSLPGFSTVVREGIQLSLGFTASVDIQLAVGDIQETVTVSGASPVVDIQNVEQRQVMDREVIDSIPTGKSITGYGLLVPGMVGGESWGTPLAQDSGGMSVQSRQRLAIHGGNIEDQQLEINGLDVGDAFSQGANLGFFPDTNMQEMAFNYSGNQAAIETGGVRVNMIPKEGANTFSGMVFTTFTGSGLQANNLDESHTDTNLRDPNLVDQVWSFNPNIGGPIIQDKLWFFLAHTTQRANIFPAGSYWAGNDQTIPFDRNFDDRILDTATAQEQGLNLTWQATPKDKVKLYWTNSSTSQDVYLQGRTLQTFFVAGEASIASEIDTNTYQATWVRPQTNRLLFEAGFSHHPIGWTFLPTDRAVTNLPGFVQVGPEIMAIRNIAGWLSGATERYSPKQINSYRGSVSYVTGSHNVKFGFSALRQWTGTFQTSEGATPPWTDGWNYGSSPIRIRYFGSSSQEERTNTIGLYVQDQWTLDRLTVNAGLRWDYVNGGYPDTVRPTNIWVTEPFAFPGETLLTWKDVQPRIGVAYDLMGNGRTALKFSANRYGKREANDWIRSGHPSTANRTNTRSWYDVGCIGTATVCIAGDGIPQGDPNNFAPNGELMTPNTNLSWGQPVRTRFFDPDWAFGYGQRLSNWETTAGIQQELMDGVSLDIGYFHREWINHSVVDDQNLSASDFDSYQVQIPDDPRLPNAGQMITLFDQNPASITNRNSHDTSADNFGGETEKFDGVDITIDARIENVLLQGGFSTGRIQTDQCGPAAQLPESNIVDFGNRQLPLEYCAVGQNWLSQVKLIGSYTFPYDIQVAATLQNQNGPERVAQHTFRAAAIGAALGRSATTASRNVNLIEPGTLYGDRFTQLDVRFTKIFALGGSTRLRAMFDIFNLFNANSSMFEQPGFGSALWNPQVIMPGRLGKVAFQLDF